MQSPSFLTTAIYQKGTFLILYLMEFVVFHEKKKFKKLFNFFVSECSVTYELSDGNNENL